MSRKRHSTEQKSRICVWGQKGQKFGASEKYSEEERQKALKTKVFWGSERENLNGLQKLCPFCPLMPDGRTEKTGKDSESGNGHNKKAPGTATARAEKHDRTGDNIEENASGPAADEPSATESEILPLHKSAIYAKNFVLRRPSGGSQLREGRIPCQDIPLSG